MAKKIKTETSFKHDLTIDSFHDEEVQVKAHKTSFKEYDKNQNLVCEINYESSGEINEKYLFKYNDKGHLVEEIIYYDEEEIAERITYERNSDGVILKEYNHYLDETFDTTECFYEGKQIIKKLTTDSDGNTDDLEKFKYENENLVLFEKYNNENKLVEKNSFQYDEKGNETKIIKWNEIDEFEVTQTIFYNEAGLKNKIHKYNHLEQLVEIVNLEYDDKGNAIKVTEEGQNGKLILYLTYDKHGNVIEQQEQDAQGEINHKVERKYDEDNNLIESKVAINRHGQGINLNYTIETKYEFFD